MTNVSVGVFSGFAVTTIYIEIMQKHEEILSLRICANLSAYDNKIYCV